MNAYQNIIIGFGKGGKTLAGRLAKEGQTTVLVEASPLRYGGTCINVACIPTKSMEHSARLSYEQGGDFAAKGERYRRAVEKKNALTAALRQKNYEKVRSAGVDVLVGTAAFLDDRRVAVTAPDGTVTELTGERMFINTGAAAFVPPIPGLKESRYAVTSEGMLERTELPRHLLIVGGGYIGMEFASYYANFGAQVTVVQDSVPFLPREDQEVAAEVLKSLTDRGVRIIRGAVTERVSDGANGAEVTLKTAEGTEQLTADAILIATGRRPNLEGLHPEKAGIILTDRGAVAVDEHLRTNVPHIWAMGDVVGGLQFTYISLDDSRIIADQLFGVGGRTTENRGPVPYSVFLDPPFSRVGLTESEALARGYKVKLARLQAAAIPKAKVLGRPDGLLKAVVDAQTDQILGAHLFCADSHEMINLVRLAMEAGQPYTVLRDAIYTHPTMSEGFNDLFATLK